VLCKLNDDDDDDDDEAHSQPVSLQLNRSTLL